MNEQTYNEIRQLSREGHGITYIVMYFSIQGSEYEDKTVEAVLHAQSYKKFQEVTA